MTSLILVTGGTGTLGRLVVPRLQQAGYAVRILSRQEHAPTDGVEYVRGDLATGAGADAAVDGVAKILHLAGSAKGDDVKTRNLVSAATAADVQHIVYISVVGADRVPIVSGIDRAMFGYFGYKYAAEQIVAESGLPYTILRATQFHQAFLGVARQMTKMPVIPVPSGSQFQPIDADEVAARLVELTLGPPSGLVPEIAGPRVYSMKDLIGGYLTATDRRRPFVSLRFPGRAARAFRNGANLAPDRAVGHRTWEDFVAEHAA